MALDKLIHEHSRLRIVTFLASSEKKAVSFGEIKQELEFTAGNLSIQLKKLNEAGYIGIKKTFKDNKPLTTVTLKAKGLKAFEEYLNEMESIIKSFKTE